MPHYPEILYWYVTYCNAGITDQRAVETFIDCENRERVNTLRIQLYAVSQGKYDESVLLRQLGRDRKDRYGSFQRWAKMMLQWIAQYSRQ
ncbi:MAG: hypothetical protein ACO3XO_10245 [Bdellovibrionota bacterium]